MTYFKSFLQPVTYEYTAFGKVGVRLHLGIKL